MSWHWLESEETEVSQGSTEICMCSALFLLISRWIEFLRAPQMLISEGCRPMADYSILEVQVRRTYNAAALDLRDRALIVTLQGGEGSSMSPFR